MTWYPAYDRNHTLLGTLHVRDGTVADEDLRRRKVAQLTGVKRTRLEDFVYSRPPTSTVPIFHVIVKLENVWSEKRPIFSYVTLLNEENPVAWPVMDPELDWFGATFVPLGAPLMCEYCPERKTQT